MKKKLVVLSGAGVSAESGIKTFRDSGGLWEGHDIMDVATPDGWRKNQELVLDFYNQRRKQGLDAKPNDAHKILAELEKDFNVVIITQNVDDLHEKAGSTNVIHLHGELFKVRSTVDEKLVYDIKNISSNGWELKKGDTCEKGSQLRPNIVWFGEMVPMMEVAAKEAVSSEVFIVIGTSLVVYPAAGLIDYVRKQVPKFIIDPHLPDIRQRENMFLYAEKATDGMKIVADKLRKEYI